ncbi:hypothetical protein CYMTET_40674 [Cymbomonas tetramitiformis]|uniref:Protein kinase domain-containing protein n=1 Tax=Cymbomonas tetramitiformis TaxID=36881 RepID=A0AAE0C7J4_9CHLO|nr:hypothetical protein CYMTET_40674 [Cymbomonas tetramitiformis]
MDAHANVAPMTEREIADLGKKLNDGATADCLAAPDTLRDSFDPRIVYTRALKCTYRSPNNDNAIWKYASVGGGRTFLLKTCVCVQRGHINHVELEGMPVLVPHKWLRVASDKTVATVLIANGKRVWSAVCMLAAVCDIRRLLRCCPSDTKMGMQIMRASMRAIAQLVEYDVMQHDFKWENCAMITAATGEHRFCIIDTASVRRIASDARVKRTYVRPSRFRTTGETARTISARDFAWHYAIALLQLCDVGQYESVTRLFLRSFGSDVYLRSVDHAELYAIVAGIVRPNDQNGAIFSMAMRFFTLARTGNPRKLMSTIRASLTT